MMKNFCKVLSVLFVFTSFCSSNIVLAEDIKYKSMFTTDKSEIFSVKLNKTNENNKTNDFDDIKYTVNDDANIKKITYKPMRKHKKKNKLIRKQSRTIRKILRSGKTEPKDILKYLKKRNVKVTADVAVELSERISERHINNKRMNQVDSQLKKISKKNNNEN